ncbi:MAG: hypothetical protein JNM84_12415 [Planctomycetes bacterium]|nr:hypothetical protein [Planctomycetota bacterium]
MSDAPKLPNGSERVAIGFTAEDAPSGAVLLLADAATKRRAVARATEPRESFTPGSGAGIDLELWLVPTSGASREEEEVLVEALRAELVAAGERDSAAPSPPVVVALQSAYVLWSPGVLVLLAPRERWLALRRAAIDAAFVIGELRAIEEAVEATWPELEADASLAFEGSERALPRRDELRARFSRVLALRMRLSRLAPRALLPHVHPPTLASQLAERLRERARLPERLEHLREKLELQFHAVELASQRFSDYALARTGHTLEWVIIVLLAGQTILLLVELLADYGAA